MIDWDNVAPMIVAVVLILTVGGVAVLRPIAKRISDLLELYARDKQSGLENDVGQIRDLLETMNARLAAHGGAAGLHRPSPHGREENEGGASPWLT